MLRLLSITHWPGDYPSADHHSVGSKAIKHGMDEGAIVYACVTLGSVTMLCWRRLGFCCPIDLLMSLAKDDGHDGGWGAINGSRLPCLAEAQDLGYCITLPVLYSLWGRFKVRTLLATLTTCVFCISTVSPEFLYCEALLDKLYIYVCSCSISI